MLAHRTTIHESLGDDRQTRVDDVRLTDVKHKVRVLDDVHPEPEREAETGEGRGALVNGVFH